MKEILITSSVLIAVLLLLRVIFAKKVSRVLIYSAWILVALRLLIPVQIGEIDFSVLTVAQPVIEAVDERVEDAILGTAPEKSYEYHIQHYIEKDPSVFIPEVQEQIQQEISQGTQTREEIFEKIQQEFPEQEILTPEGQETVQMLVGIENTTLLHNADMLVNTVWAVSIAAMAVWFTIVNLRHSRMLLKNREKLECDSPIPVYVSEKVGSPCLVGLFRPAIYLTPECAASEETMRHVLTHELTHYAHKDHIWSVVRCICLCVYWFNPLVWVAAWFSRRDCELACDEGALKRLGEEERIAYGRSLLDVVSHASAPANLMQTATAMNETKKQLKERVNFIVKKPKISLIAAICMVLVCAIVAGCAAAGPGNLESSTKDPMISSSSNPTEPTQPKEPTKEVALLTQMYTMNGNYSAMTTGWVLYDEQWNISGYISVRSGNMQSDTQIVVDAENHAVEMDYGQQVYGRSTFDEMGRMLTYGYYVGDFLDTSIVFTYDAQGRLVNKKDTRYRDSVIPNVVEDIWEDVYTYDAQGRLETHTQYQYSLIDGQEVFLTFVAWRCSYDEGGLLVRKDGYGQGEELTQYITYTYDLQQRAVTETHFTKGDRVEKIVTTYYDPDGRPIKVMEDDTYIVTTYVYCYQVMQVPEDMFVPVGVLNMPATIQPFWTDNGQNSVSVVFEQDIAQYDNAVKALEEYATTGKLIYRFDVGYYSDERALRELYAVFARLGDYKQSAQYLQEMESMLREDPLGRLLGDK